MASYDYGKTAIIEKIINFSRDHFSGLADGTLRILDVGTCDGKWADLMRNACEADGRDLIIDGVEAFKPNAARCLDKYECMFVGPAFLYHYPSTRYDIVIFGDVIEHMEVLEARFCISYAINNAKDIVVGVPFLYPQGPIYGNPFERHIQDDLTLEVMAKRYPDLELLLQPTPNYAYYHAKGGPLK